MIPPRVRGPGSDESLSAENQAPIMVDRLSSRGALRSTFTTMRGRVTSSATLTLAVSLSLTSIILPLNGVEIGNRQGQHLLAW